MFIKKKFSLFLSCFLRVWLQSLKKVLKVSSKSVLDLNFAPIICVLNFLKKVKFVVPYCPAHYQLSYAHPETSRSWQKDVIFFLFLMTHSH
jgi:hypothetical protein